MFHINDLNDMDDSQIRETAESMGVKKRHLYREMKS